MRKQCKLDVVDSLIHVMPRAAAGRADEIHIDHAVFAAEAIFAVVHQREAAFVGAQIDKFLAGYFILRFFNAVVFRRFPLDVAEGHVEAAFLRVNRGGKFDAQHPAFLMAVDGELHLQRGGVIHQTVFHRNGAVANAVSAPGRCARTVCHRFKAGALCLPARTLIVLRADIPTIAHIAVLRDDGHSLCSVCEFALQPLIVEGADKTVCKRDFHAVVLNQILLRARVEGGDFV